ncbi:hypothetical protein NL676_024842 [Syzygium grande]|nr:hypothetical protein NL676_024842 [Syzygium grande]
MRCSDAYDSSSQFEVKAMVTAPLPSGYFTFPIFCLLLTFPILPLGNPNHSNLSKAKPSGVQAFPVSLLPPRLTPCSERVARRQTPFPLVASPLASLDVLSRPRLTPRGLTSHLALSESLDVDRLFLLQPRLSPCSTSSRGLALGLPFRLAAVAFRLAASPHASRPRLTPRSLASKFRQIHYDDAVTHYLMENKLEVKRLRWKMMDF